MSRFGDEVNEMPTYIVYETYHSVRSVVVDAADEDDAIERAGEIDWDDWERDPISSWAEGYAELLPDPLGLKAT